MYLRRIRLANWLKSCSSFCRIWFSFVTGVGINFNPLESNLVWSGVNWKSVRFLMCLLLDFVFSIFLLRLLNLLRLLRFWFSSLRFLTNFPPSILWRFYDLFLAAQSACDVNTKHDNTVSNCVTLLAMNF